MKLIMTTTADAAFANTNNHKSTTGYVFLKSDHVEIKEANRDHIFVNGGRICSSLRGFMQSNMAQKLVQQTRIPSK